MKRLLLASASPARRKTLISAGIEPVVRVSDVDEDALLGGLPPEAAEQVLALARAKAEDVAGAEIAAGNPLGIDVVVGCDSMFEIDGSIVGKPYTADVARERLRVMSDNSGVLHTGHCVIDLATGKSASGVSEATVHIGHLSDHEIEAYIGSGEPLWVAGSFTIDGLGGPFVERIEGDHHGVVGISLPLLRHLLAELGHSVVDFWAPPSEGSQTELEELS